MKMQQFQRGGFAIGLVVGLLVGLALALGVALYVTKVPVPFVNKVPQRTAEQDAAEAERNKNWDPNAPLYGKNPARPASAVATTVPPPGITPVEPPQPASALPGKAPRDNARTAIAAAPDKATTPDKATLQSLFASSPASTKPGADPFTYFVQAGAYGRGEDAEQQRARLAMLGFAAKVTEREQSGRTVYRVRLGPFERKEEADAAKEKLDGNSVDAALVRVQK
jgi:cell division protein FtsN